MAKNKPTLDEERLLWQKGYTHVIGVDEVGRGSFAGPVVTAACMFHPSILDSLFLLHDSKIVIDDSKRLTPQQRTIAATWIRENCFAYAIAEVNVATINRVGIGKATQICMRKSIATLLDCSIANKSKFNNLTMKQFNNYFMLIDAFYIPHTKGVPKTIQKPIIKGDQKSISIASASILAKVYRDGLMNEIHLKFPQYLFAQNKGYGTRDHRIAICKHGLSKLHRKSFSLAKYLA